MKDPDGYPAVGESGCDGNIGDHRGAAIVDCGENRDGSGTAGAKADGGIVVAPAVRIGSAGVVGGESDGRSTPSVAHNHIIGLVDLCRRIDGDGKCLGRTRAVHAAVCK